MLKQYWPEILALLIFIILPALMPNWVLGDIAIYFTYAIFAASLGFLWGHAGLLCLGQAVFFGIGAYAMSTVTLAMTPLPASSLIGLLLSMAVPAAVAFLLGSFFFASKGLKGAFFGIVTLALAFIFERIAINSSWLGGLNGLMNIPSIKLLGHDISTSLHLYFSVLAILALIVLLLDWIKSTRFGLSLAAIRENELRAESLGLDTRQLKVLAFSLSGAVAGLAGALFVSQFGFASPSLIGFSLSAEVLIWVALGGRSSILAAALGAIAVRFVESQLSDSLGDIWPLIAGLLFMLSVLVLPRGVFGEILARLKGR